MMRGPGRIIALPEKVASTVRSTSVISTLSAAAEELIFNALDAGAETVAVGVQWSDFSVRVEDDGHGISASDFALLGTRHATSKGAARSSAPQQYAAGYGRRGEALASIAQLSTVEVTSRAAGADEVNGKILRQGSTLWSGPVRPSAGGAASSGHGEAAQAVSSGTSTSTASSSACQAAHIPTSSNSAGAHSSYPTMSASAHTAASSAGGTVVVVRDFLSTQPVRRRTLSSLAAQRQDSERLVAAVTRAALAHPNVSFTVRDMDAGRLLLMVPRAASLLARFAQLFGAARAKALNHVVSHTPCHSSGMWRVEGYMGRDAASKDMQFLCINGRMCKRVPQLASVIDAAAAAASAAAAAAEEEAEAAQAGRRSRGSTLASGSTFRSRSTNNKLSDSHRDAVQSHLMYVLRLSCPPSTAPTALSSASSTSDSAPSVDIVDDGDRTLVAFADPEGAKVALTQAVRAALGGTSCRVSSGSSGNSGSATTAPLQPSKLPVPAAIYAVPVSVEPAQGPTDLDSSMLSSLNGSVLALSEGEGEAEADVDALNASLQDISRYAAGLQEHGTEATAVADGHHALGDHDGGGCSDHLHSEPASEQQAHTSLDVRQLLYGNSVYSAGTATTGSVLNRSFDALDDILFLPTASQTTATTEQTPLPASGSVTVASTAAVTPAVSKYFGAPTVDDGAAPQVKRRRTHVASASLQALVPTVPVAPAAPATALLQAPQHRYYIPRIGAAAGRDGASMQLQQFGPVTSAHARLLAHTAALGAAGGGGGGLAVSDGGAGVTVTRTMLQRMVVIGQLDRKFILTAVPLPGGARQLYIVDQHAADERVRLETLTTALFGPAPAPTDTPEVSMTSEEGRCDTIYVSDDGMFVKAAASDADEGKGMGEGEERASVAAEAEARGAHPCEDTGSGGYRYFARVSLHPPIAVELTPVEQLLVQQYRWVLSAWGYDLTAALSTRPAPQPQQNATTTTTTSSSARPRVSPASLLVSSSNPAASTTSTCPRWYLATLPRLFDVNLTPADLKDFLGRLVNAPQFSKLESAARSVMECEALQQVGSSSSDGRSPQSGAADAAAVHELRCRLLHAGCRPPAVIRILNSKACRGAVMFGDALSHQQCEAVVAGVRRTALPFNCAHGRPSMIPLLTLTSPPGS